MRAERVGIGIIWGAAVVAAVLIGVLASADRRLAWVSIAMLLLVFAAAIVQLVIARPDGFIHRISVSLGGATAVLAVASLVFWLTGSHGFVFAGR